MEPKIAIKQLKALRRGVKNMRLAAENWKNPFQTLISIILSARSRDEKTISVATQLFKKYPTAQKLSRARISEIQKIIRPINFYKNKSKNIIDCSKVLVEKFKGKIPKDIDKLLELPGVGRKTANVFLSEYGSQAIGVDTHVFYISRYLDWTKAKTSDKIEESLKELFPKRYWSKVNPTLVRFGKTHTSRKNKNKLLDEIKKIK